MSVSCSRLFEVEAARDGRLTGAELESFEHHAARCSACARETRSLDDLAKSLRTSVDEALSVDQLHVRRERTRLLAAFDDVLVSPARRSIPFRVWVTAMVFMVVTVGFFVQRIRRPRESGAVASSAVIRADQTAVWSDHVEGNRESVVLERGELWIRVDHRVARPRLVVVLPDGELEDTGTTFRVSVEDRHTTRVDVEEGSVVLRLRDEPAILLDAGDAWAPNQKSAPLPSTSASIATPSDATANAPIRSKNAVASITAARATSDPSVDFRAAMAALDVGDNTRAAAAFASFHEKYPGDSRAEDAAYLRVIALQRSGDAIGTKQAALDYLRSYPTGFRRAEIAPLAR